MVTNWLKTERSCDRELARNRVSLVYTQALPKRRIYTVCACAKLDGDSYNSVPYRRLYIYYIIIIIYIFFFFFFYIRIYIHIYIHIYNKK